MGGAVAVVLIGVVVAALGAEEQGGEHEQPAAVQAGAADQPCGGKASLADLITGCD